MFLRHIAGTRVRLATGDAFVDIHRQIVGAALAWVGWFAAVEPASATWSIVGVDAETGEVGIAAATCGTSVQYIAGIVPGMGAVAAQAATSFKGRDAAGQWIAEGSHANDILQKLSNPDFYDNFYNAKFPVLQYGVATLNETPEAGFVSGDAIIPWSGGIVDDGPNPSWSVQGNTLRASDVIEAAAAAMRLRRDHECRLSLSERLMRALEAGRDAGGDKRCPIDAPAYSAILFIARPADSSDTITRLVAPRSVSLWQSGWDLVFGYEPEPGAMEPVAHLRQKWHEAGEQACLSQDETAR